MIARQRGHLLDQEPSVPVGRCKLGSALVRRPRRRSTPKAKKRRTACGVHQVVAAGLLVFLAVLLLRPQGFFGRKEP